MQQKYRVRLGQALHAFTFDEEGAHAAAAASVGNRKNASSAAVVNAEGKVIAFYNRDKHGGVDRKLVLA